MTVYLGTFYLDACLSVKAYCACLPFTPKMSGHLPQPMHKSAASSYLPNVLTLRIYHENSSFSAKSTTQLTACGTNSTRCACSRIPRLWIGANEVSQPGFLLPETPQRTTVLRFVFRTAANTEKANNLCIISRKSPSSEPFRKRMRKLLTDLAAMCEEEHPLDQTNPRSTAGSVPFSPFRTSYLDRNAVSEELRAKIFSPLAASEIQGQGMGYVYILRATLDIDALSVLKIGFSKYHPEHRAHELGSCLSGPEVVAHTPLIPHAKRVESLIHTELVANRKVRACGQCGLDHGEWFTISHAESRKIVIRWSEWILRQPYIDGKLSEEWQSYLQKQHFVSAKPKATLSKLWGDILDGFPRQKSDPSPEDQLAAYLNACYWSAIAGRIAGPSKGSFASLQNALQDCRKSGRPLEIRDFQTAMEGFISSDFKTELKPDVIAVLVRDSESQMQPDPSTRPRRGSDLRREHETWKEELRRQMESIKNLKTGGFSVSDPEQGITESPLGDATLLPVVSLKALHCLDAPARNWIGYNPTHQGFQMLQEAYQRGEWVGHIPQFKLPRAFRKAGTTNLRTQAVAAGTNAADTPASSGKPRRANENAKGRETKVEVLSEPNSQQFTFSKETIGDDMIKEMKEMQELMKFPLGRALVEKEMVRQFRQLGIHADGSYEAVSSSEDSEDSSSDDDDDKMDVDEPEPKCQKVRTPRPVAGIGNQRVVADLLTLNRQQRPTSSSGPGITKSKAKKWLESL